MILKTVFKRTTLALVFGGMLSISSLAVAKQKLRVASNFPAEHSVSQSMEIFKKEVEKASNGEIEVDLFPAMMLGGAAENVDQTRSGTVFATLLSVAYLSRVVPEFEAVSLPFLFTSRDDAYRVVDGKIGETLDEKMAEKGFKGLGFGELGFRQVTNSVRPIETIDDFKDLKIRLQPNEVHLNTFRALGANPVSMDISEVYSALQQGVLDGQENPYDTIFTRRFNEVQKYLSNSGHFFDFMAFVANKRAFEKLSEANQKIILDAAHTAMQWQRKESETQDADWRDKLIESGMVYTEISDDARNEMRKATQPVVDDIKKRVNPEVVDAVMAEVVQ